MMKETNETRGHKAIAVEGVGATRAPKNRQKKIQTGLVVSDKMTKTRVVRVSRLICHPVFKKYYKRNSKFNVHDEKNLSQVGDRVEIVESRPLSKTKRWVLRKVLQKAVA